MSPHYVLMQMVPGNTTVRSGLYDAIKHDIIFGKLKPATKLKLGETRIRYQTSVATLRETLNRLASEGFVQAEEQRGFFVAPISPDDLTEIANLRVLLEGHALRESITQGDAEWEADIVAAYSKLKLMEDRLQDGDEKVREIWKRFDREFHQALIQACRSKNLLALHATIYEKYLRYQMQLLTFRGKSAAREHKKLLDHALNRDSDAAEKVLRAHVFGGLKHAMSGFAHESTASK